MKFTERSARRPQLKAAEVLDHAAPAEPAVFDIRRDMSPSDWNWVAKKISLEFGYASPDIEFDVTQLVVLGAENRSGLDMEIIHAQGLEYAKRNFQSRLGEDQRAVNVINTQEPLIDWMIMAPEEKATLLSGPLGPNLKSQFWSHFNNYFHLPSGAGVELPLALLLLFPEDRDRILEKCDLPSLKIDLERALKWNIGTPLAYNLALLTSLLYPGQAQDLITPTLVGRIREADKTLGSTNFILNAFATFDLLSAERVWLDNQGQIQIERQKPVVPRTQELPPRKLV